MPKNILMIGSTGVGKTEIARRLAKLTNSPFLKVEASKFTEVGYVGRDVESIVRDLVEVAIDMVREEKLEEIEDRAELAAEDRLLEMLIDAAERVARTRGARRSPSHTQPSSLGRKALKTPTSRRPCRRTTIVAASASACGSSSARAVSTTGSLNSRPATAASRRSRSSRNQPPDDMENSGLRDMLSGLLSQRTRKRQIKVAEAFDYLVQEEESRLLDMDQVTRVAVERVEDSGIVFLDEIDKIAGREGGHGPDISREGVQRDILPIVEGTTVNTKYGFVATDHILFIAAGAFHVSKPSDLIPELQGRFPIRVELKPLTVEDFLRILTEPRASLAKQSIALLETEGLKLEFASEALEEMARFAFQVNENTENIGARRLHTIMEKVLDEISFHAPDLVKAPAGRSRFAA